MKYISVEKREQIWLFCIERPEVRNAIDRATAEELAEAFRSFESDPESRVGVLYGRGEHFCAGADLKAVASGKLNRLEEEGDAPLGPTRMLLSKPVIAAISGYAVAGGLELALWCDLRVIEENGCLGFFERRWGVPLIDGGTVRLPRLIGLSRALDLILTGRKVLSTEALAIGLVNRVVEKGEALSEALSLAEQIAASPQVCMRNDRLSAHLQFDLELEDALRQEFRLGVESMKQEALAGAKLFARGAGRHGQFELESEGKNN